MSALRLGWVLLFALPGCFDPKDSPSTSTLSSASTDGSSTSDASTSSASSASASTTGPDCPEGSAGCPCYGNGTCDAGLTCNATVQACIPDDCDPGSLACTCNEGLCLGDLECLDGICQTPSASTGLDTSAGVTDAMTTTSASDTLTTATVTTDLSTSSDSGSVSPECQMYCDAYLFTCNNGEGGAISYVDENDCLTTCAGFAPGAEGDTSGNTLQCRLYHVGAAAGDPDLHCPHASIDGGGICV